MILNLSKPGPPCQSRFQVGGICILFSFSFDMKADLSSAKHIAIVNTHAKSIITPNLITYSEEDISWSHSVYFIGSSRYTVGWSMYTGLTLGTAFLSSS